MKKLISGILSAAMVAGMALVGAGAADENNKALKFDDTVLSEGGAANGYMSLDTGDKDNSLFSEGGMTLEFDFTMGHTAPCIHPFDATLYHTPKLNITIGSNGDGEFKYFGYNAEGGYFYLANSKMSPNVTEGSSDWKDVDINSARGDGLGYLVKSAAGLVIPGETYKVAFELKGESEFTAYLNGEKIIDFDMYDDMISPMFFDYTMVLFYARHICCYIDNLALYKEGVYNPATGEGRDQSFGFCDFDNTYFENEEQTKKDGTTETVTVVKNADIINQIMDPRAFAFVDPALEIYGQKLNTAEEGVAALSFEKEIVSKSGRTFEADLAVSSNPGFRNIELYLLQDPLITVESVTGANGLTASYDDEEGKLTITTPIDYTADGVIATITYKMAGYKKVSSDETNLSVQDFSYGFGADVNDYKFVGSDGANKDIAICNSSTKVFNYAVGDLNGDGRYDINDAITILKIVAKWDLPDVFREAGDVNGDGRTNLMDAQHYLKAVAGWKGFSVGTIVN